MDDDPFADWGLKPVELADRALLNSYFSSLADPLSDYTFSQLFTWRNSLRILWKIVRGHLCVFANGSGDLTLLLPPIGETNSDPALAEAFELMDAYNAAHGVPGRSRVEYAGEELLARFDRSQFSVQPMGADYVYDVRRMIDLAGGDLSSKRQAKNRFIRNYQHRVEEYRAEEHRQACLELLDHWKIHQDASHLEEPNTSSIKRSKESIATALCLETAEQLGLTGMVVYVRDDDSSGAGSWRIRGFTFGEPLGRDQSSITIEKTDLEIRGLAQFIFSEFCSRSWGHLPFVNVGDDWGLPSLAWTKMSYRPVKLLGKFVLRMQPVKSLATTAPGLPTPARSFPEAPSSQIDLGAPLDAVAAADDSESGSLASGLTTADTDLVNPPTVIRTARKSDLDAAEALEKANFNAESLSRRQLQYLQGRQTAIFLVGDQNGEVVGDGIALIRQHRKGRSGRIYSLVVRAESRGQRIGHKLLGAMIESLVARGVKRIYLEVETSNAGAVRLYEQFGFEPIGCLPDYYGTGKDALHMMFEVKEPKSGVKQLLRHE